MTVAAPGYPRPNTTEVKGWQIEVGSPDGRSWRPLGAYMAGTGFEWDWAIPTTGEIFIKGNHPLASYLSRPRRKVILIRTWRNGIPWTGRVMEAQVSGPPGRLTIKLTCISHLFKLLRALAWVNNTTPPEFQLNITGKQDIDWGPPDQVLKKFVSKVMTRLRSPVVSALPIRRTTPDLPDLDDVETLDDMINIVHESPDDMIILAARFTQLDELFKQTVETQEIGLSMDFWEPSMGPSPHVFNTHTLAMLQSVMDYTSDNFLNFTNPGNILGLTNPSEWGKLQNPGFIFNTHAKRDRRQYQWRTDSDQIAFIRRTEKSCDATRVAIGGKAPEILNQVIEWGANFALQLILNAILPGLGLGNIIGDLFDDIFFAFQQFWDPELEAELGELGRGEAFGDNTSAWSLDAFAVGQAALKAHSGSEAIELTIVDGGADGRGFTFGADIEVIDGVEVQFERRYKVGDIMTVWDDGVVIEKHVSNVKITEQEDGRMRTVTTFGDAITVGEGWERVLNKVQTIFGSIRAIANST